LAILRLAGRLAPRCFRGIDFLFPSRPGANSAFLGRGLGAPNSQDDVEFFAGLGAQAGVDTREKVPANALLVKGRRAKQQESVVYRARL
jgi:hypothetical protein